MTDPIADMLTRIRNAVQAKKTEILIPYSKIKFNIAQILVKNGYLKEAKKVTSGNFAALKLSIDYSQPRKMISKLVRVSSPGRRVYVKANQIKKVFGGQGIAIISTSKGVMTGYEAYSRGIGGELICKVW